MTSSMDTGFAPAWLAADALLLVHSDCSSSSLTGRARLSATAGGRAAAGGGQEDLRGCARLPHRNDSSSLRILSRLASASSFHSLSARHDDECG